LTADHIGARKDSSMAQKSLYLVNTSQEILQWQPERVEKKSETLKWINILHNFSPTMK
jgi:hypothetical protein